MESDDSESNNHNPPPLDLDDSSDNDSSDDELDLAIVDFSSDVDAADSVSTDIYEADEYNRSTLDSIERNSSSLTDIKAKGGNNGIVVMTDEEWGELGIAISNNTHLKTLKLYKGAIDDHKMSFLFQGLTRSSSITHMLLFNNGFSKVGVQSMVPFLQNTSNLTKLDLDNNNLQSEGFNLLFRSLHDSPIKQLDCDGCGIESIEIDSEHIPRHLEHLYLENNKINADGCRGLAEFLQAGDVSLFGLYLQNNNIDDAGVAILVDALRSNITLTRLLLKENDGISQQGKIMLLKLVNDISSIKATLQSNHTLRNIYLDSSDADAKILMRINMATVVNRENYPEEAGRVKVIETQLHSDARAELAELQGITESVYSEINPLHLPEVLSIIDESFGFDLGELYVALKSSIAGVISTVDERQCLVQERAYYRAKIAEYETKISEFKTEMEAVEAKIQTIDTSEGRVVDVGSEFRSNKRRRKFWWGLWGGD